MNAFLRELFSDLWRIFKLTAGSIAIPLVLYLLLLWTGVLK